MVKIEAPEATPMEARVMTTMVEVASLAGDDSELESEELVGEKVGVEVNCMEEVKRREGEKCVEGGNGNEGVKRCEGEKLIEDVKSSDEENS